MKGILLILIMLLSVLLISCDTCVYIDEHPQKGEPIYFMDTGNVKSNYDLCVLLSEKVIKEKYQGCGYYIISSIDCANGMCRC